MLMIVMEIEVLPGNIDFLAEHLEKTILYTILGIMVGLLLLLSFCLCLTLASVLLRRRKKRQIIKRLSGSSRTNTSTQTAESSTLIPSPSEHDFGLELLSFMHNGPPVRRDGRFAWMDALERQPLRAPLTNYSAAPAAAVDSQQRLCIPVSSTRLCDSFQQEIARGKSRYSPSYTSSESQVFCKSLNDEQSLVALNEISPSDSHSRGLVSNCTTRFQFGTASSPSTCESGNQLHPPRAVSSFLHAQPFSSDATRSVKEMLPNSISGQSAYELPSFENKTSLEGSLVVLANTSSSSKGLSRSLQNSPRDTGATCFDSFYSNPNRHNTFRLTSRSTQMLSD